LRIAAPYRLGCGYQRVLRLLPIGHITGRSIRTSLPAPLVKGLGHRFFRPAKATAATAKRPRLVIVPTCLGFWKFTGQNVT
jgi:hypothetical protein